MKISKNVADTHSKKIINKKINKIEIKIHNTIKFMTFRYKMKNPSGKVMQDRVQLFTGL